MLKSKLKKRNHLVQLEAKNLKRKKKGGEVSVEC